MFEQLDHIPEGFLECKAEDLHKLMSDCTLIQLEGRQKQPLFLSVLLHGNETTGLFVIQNILKKYSTRDLPRSITLFVGNVSAAKENKRRLAKQPDFNRIWVERPIQDPSGIHDGIQELLHEISATSFLASIDIHNNTGINPHYACINKLDSRFLNLAKEFSRTVIYFVRPSGVQSKAFSHLCPSVTLECGKVGDEIGIQLATRFVDSVLNWNEVPTNPVSDQDIDLFHTTAIIKIPENISFSFEDETKDLCFIHGIESMNFEEIPAGTALASVKAEQQDVLIALDEDGNDIYHQIFQINGDQLITRNQIMPSMLTLDERVIRQDCLCYVMERYEIRQGEKITDDEMPVWNKSLSN